MVDMTICILILPSQRIITQSSTGSNKLWHRPQWFFCQSVALVEWICPLVSISVGQRETEPEVKSGSASDTNLKSSHLKNEVYLLQWRIRLLFRGVSCECLKHNFSPCLSFSRSVAVFTKLFTRKHIFCCQWGEWKSGSGSTFLSRVDCVAVQSLTAF